MGELREMLAREIAAELGRQDYMHGEPFNLPPALTLPYLDQSEVDFGKIADRILAIPEIADALRMKAIQPMPIRKQEPASAAGSHQS